MYPGSDGNFYCFSMSLSVLSSADTFRITSSRKQLSEYYSIEILEYIRPLVRAELNKEHRKHRSIIGSGNLGGSEDMSRVTTWAYV